MGQESKIHKLLNTRGSKKSVNHSTMRGLVVSFNEPATVSIPNLFQHQEVLRSSWVEE